jgi:RNA-directed DNA polymerase
MTTRTTDKPFNITKRQVYEAYKAVKSNGGEAGLDRQTIEQFDADLRNNLYKLWNRMSSEATFRRRCGPSPFPRSLGPADFGCADRERQDRADGSQTTD